MLRGWGVLPSAVGFWCVVYRSVCVFVIGVQGVSAVLLLTSGLVVCEVRLSGGFLGGFNELYCELWDIGPLVLS